MFCVVVITVNNILQRKVIWIEITLSLTLHRKDVNLYCELSTIQLNVHTCNLYKRTTHFVKFIPVPDRNI